VQTRFYTGDLAGVEAHFALLSPLIDTVGVRQAPGNNVISIGVASVAAWALGHTELAHARMDRALAIARGSNNPYDLAMTLHFQDILFSCERGAGQVEAAATQLLALSEENGFTYALEMGRSALGWARAQLGATAEGVELMRQARANLAGSGATVGRTFGLKQLAEAEALDGQTEQALATYEEALTANPQERVFRPVTLWSRGELHRRLGQTDLARADLDAAVAFAREIGAKAWEERATESLALLS
jgi:tetratricopeptide (TPR) repeat protein